MINICLGGTLPIVRQFEVNAANREAATRRSYEAAELLQAKEFVADQPSEAQASCSNFSLGLSKTKVENTLRTCKAKSLEIAKTIHETTMALFEKINEQVAATPSSGLEQAKTDLTKAKVAADAFLQVEVENKLKGVQDSLESLANKADCSRALSILSVVTKTMKKGAVSAFNLLAGKTKKFLADEARAGARRLGAAAGVVSSEAPVNVLWTCLENLDQEQFKTTVSHSMFEAKGGVRPATCRGNPEFDALTEVGKNAYVRKCCKDLDAHVRTSGSTHANIVLREAPKAKRVLQILRKGFDPMLFTKLMLPDEEWALRVYQFDICFSANHNTNIGTSQFGCTECRIMLEGSEVLVGVPFEKVPGTSFKDKRLNVTRMTVDDITTMVRDNGGFSIKLSADDDLCAIIPSGFLLISASTHCKYLRWNISSDAQDSIRVKIMLKELLHDFPEMRADSQPHQKFYDLLCEQHA